MRSLHAALLTVAVTASFGCDTTAVGDEASYEGTITVPWIETAVHRGSSGSSQTCQHTYDVTMVLKVTMSEGATTAEGDGNLDIRATGRPSSTPNCGTPQSWNSGGFWTAPLTGTKADLRSTASRCSSPNSAPPCPGTSFQSLTIWTFAGAQHGSEVTGTLTLTRTGSGITGEATQSTTNASGSYAVTLR